MDRFDVSCYPSTGQFLYDGSTLTESFGNFIAMAFELACFSRKMSSSLPCHVRLFIKLSLTSQVPGYPCKCFHKDSMCWRHLPASSSHDHECWRACWMLTICLTVTFLNNPGSKCPVTLKGSCSYGMKPENKGQRRRDDGGQEREMGSHHPQAPQVYPWASDKWISGAADGSSSKMFIGNECDLNNVLADKHQPDGGRGQGEG